MTKLSGTFLNLLENIQILETIKVPSVAIKLSLKRNWALGHCIFKQHGFNIRINSWKAMKSIFNRSRARLHERNDDKDLLFMLLNFYDLPSLSTGYMKSMNDELLERCRKNFVWMFTLAGWSTNDGLVKSFPAAKTQTFSPSSLRPWNSDCWWKQGKKASSLHHRLCSDSFLNLRALQVKVHIHAYTKKW